MPLATLKADDLVPLRIPILLDALAADEPVAGDPVMAAAAAARIGTGERRPSVEILFHALIPDALVLHVHPLVANALTCNADGPRLTRELLGDEAVWVDYVDPGVPLARRIAEARQEFQDRTGGPAPSITLMGNHGIIVSGDTHDEVAARTEWLTARIQEAIDATPAAEAELADPLDISPIAETLQVKLGAATVAVSTDGVARDASHTGAAPVSAGPLIPDQIVYSGSLPLVLAPNADEKAVEAGIQRFRAQNGRDPIVAVVPGQGVVAVGRNPNAAKTALETFLDALKVARDAERIGTVRVMDQRERSFIENWEAEAYRRQVADA
ncbi:MAG: class II aldolase [Propionibacterium sp.]|nr:class II aldolase [Propionibacterium sp.]